MTFNLPDESNDQGLEDALYMHTLPQRRCSSCHTIIPRRKHRVTLRASWRKEPEFICPTCWGTICAWAARFALQQATLQLDGL